MLAATGAVPMPKVQSPFTGAPGSKAVMPYGHIHWMFRGAARKQPALKLWKQNTAALACRPGRCDKLPADILMGKTSSASIESQLPGILYRLPKLNQKLLLLQIVDNDGEITPENLITGTEHYKPLGT